jgi:hypothetical protein
VTRRRAALAVAAAAALPRLVVLAVERGAILAEYTEKSDDIARTFVAHGTFGFVPGEPTAYTQPLYGFFLSAIYATAGRTWIAVGLIQIGVAVVSALLVYELGRRAIGPWTGLVGGVAFALHPYLVWHDVHVNREILDTALAAGLTLLTLMAAQQRRPAHAAAAGAVAGLAVLGNARLALLPLVLVAYLAWRLGDAAETAVLGAALLGAAVLVVTPWVVRNQVSVGCATLTTDSRALWKANNPATYETLAGGRFIDDVPDLPDRPLTPEEAHTVWEQTGRIVSIDECAEMRRYRRLVAEFWRDEPGEKARLAGQAARMLWDPRATRTEQGPGAGTWQDTARAWVAPLYLVPVYLLALAGAVLVPRAFAVLAVGLLGYVTLAAMVFAGATRYRVSWDFLLVLLAAAAAVEVVRRLRRRRGEPMDR